LFDDEVDIFVMDSDGANVKRVIRSPQGKVSREPHWSPDKKRIAFISDRDGLREIYVANTNGKNIRRLTHTTAGGDRSGPHWSPDGAQIAFWADGQICVVKEDGSDLHCLTSRELNAVYPSWSPDGNKIAFATRQTGNRNIYVMNANGSDAHPLTHRTGGIVIATAWSPDGKEILFTAGAGPEGPWDLWIIGADGSNERQLTKTTDAKYTSDGAWSPDGKSIVFCSTRDGTRTGVIGGLQSVVPDFEIYVMDTDGSHVRRLTFNTTPDTHPDWR
jgi:Tol biopolymer transport system component